MVHIHFNHIVWWREFFWRICLWWNIRKSSLSRNRGKNYCWHWNMRKKLPERQGKPERWKLRFWQTCLTTFVRQWMRSLDFPISLQNIQMMKRLSEMRWQRYRHRAKCWWSWLTMCWIYPKLRAESWRWRKLLQIWTRYRKNWIWWWNTAYKRNRFSFKFLTDCSIPACGVMRQSCSRFWSIYWTMLWNLHLRVERLH